jgi:hypothetical protein
MARSGKQNFKKVAVEYPLDSDHPEQGLHHRELNMHDATMSTINYFST